MREVNWLGYGKLKEGKEMGLVRGDWKHGLNEESNDGIRERRGWGGELNEMSNGKEDIIEGEGRHGRRCEGNEKKDAKRESALGLMKGSIGLLKSGGLCDGRGFV